MKLIYNISLRLSLVLFPLIALWAVVFYFTMMDEINDEADDALKDYSELIVMRVLAGEPLPRSNEGSNNSYTIIPVESGYVATRPSIDYYDTEVYIPEKDETEPARVLGYAYFRKRRSAGNSHVVGRVALSFPFGDSFRNDLVGVP